MASSALAAANVSVGLGHRNLWGFAALACWRPCGHPRPPRPSVDAILEKGMYVRVRSGGRVRLTGRGLSRSVTTTPNPLGACDAL